MSTVFVQYKYCSLCQISCKKIRKHVHSRHHQEVVKNILSKFIRKISAAKEHLERPVIKASNWKETARQCWCYFCASHVDIHLNKTTISGYCVIVNAGFLGHITRKDHSENTAKFLKDNLVDMKRTPEFLLEHEIFLRFLEKAETLSIDFLNKSAALLKQTASSIRLQDSIRQQIMWDGLLQQNMQQNSAPTCSVMTRHNRPNTVSNIEEGERKKTAQAYGEGLTIIERPSEDDSEGNVYCNATPPWMRKEEGESDNFGTIGPSIADWKKHKNLEEKRQLPACRVGAMFDHKANQDKEWLPNFGGVWSHGPRTKSGKQFRKRMNNSSLHNQTETTNINNEHEIIPQTNVDDNSHLPQNSFHSHREDNHLQDEHIQSQSCSSTGIRNSDITISSLNANHIKPYVSKRRKTTTNNFFSTTNLSPPGSKAMFGERDNWISCNSYPPYIKFSGRELDYSKNIKSNPAEKESIRLLSTPLLSNK